MMLQKHSSESFYDNFPSFAAVLQHTIRNLQNKAQKTVTNNCIETKATNTQSDAVMYEQMLYS